MRLVLENITEAQKNVLQHRFDAKIREVEAKCEKKMLGFAALIHPGNGIHQ